MASTDVTRYRWSRAYGLRFFGISVVLAAVLWVVSALCGFATWSVVLFLVGLLLVAGCLIRLVVLPPVLLELSVEGYRVRNVRGAGVAAAPWADVETVGEGPDLAGASGRSSTGPVVMVTLSDERTTLVPVALLGALAVVAEQEMHTRLNAAFGYRRLSGPRE